MYKIKKNSVENRDTYSMLPQINTSYVCRRHKWYLKFVYLPIHYSLRENNFNNLGEWLTVRCSENS